jgi:hypothetical protein
VERRLVTTCHGTDDIRFVNMVDNWNAIASPKLDLTSFGHWSGTGLVDLSEPLRLF